MKKTHIRAYCVENEGDLLVLKNSDGTWQNISPHYSDIPRDRRLLRVDAYLDVFRYENGDIAWSLGPNGHDVEAAAASRLLLQVFVEDAQADVNTPRGF